MTNIEGIDLFCGAGGMTTGAFLAASDLGLSLQMTAINHWQVAIDTHSANHSYVNHLCTGVDMVDPYDIFPSGHAHFMLAAPECTHHSRARGGKPRSKQSRAQPFMLIDWLTKINVNLLIVENVPDILSWGPLNDGIDGGQVVTGRKGTYFFAWLNTLRGIGYELEWKILTAADYGDPTTRERFFLVARRDGKPIVWPEPTHTKDPDAFERSNDLPLFRLDRKPRQKWEPARKIINWTHPSRSIFDPAYKPLAYNTRKRIAAGLKKFSGIEVDPDLLLPVANQQGVATVEALRENSFITALNHGKDDSRVYGTDRPFPTVTQVDAWAKVDLQESPSPFMVEMYGTSTARSIDDPISTVTTSGAHHGLASPFLQVYHGTGPDGRERIESIDDPLKTVDTSNRYGLVEPFLVTAGGPEGQGRNPQPLTEPLGTVLAENHRALVFSIKYYGAETSAQSIEEPLGTVTAKDRFGLVLVYPDGQQKLLDIRFRMIQPDELARAHSFPVSYKFAGSRGEIVKQIGNSVPVELARAIVRANLGD